MFACSIDTLHVVVVKDVVVIVVFFLLLLLQTVKYKNNAQKLQQCRAMIIMTR